jgi:hypothetical protein
MAVELGRGDARGVGDVVGVGQRRAGERFAAEDPPPPFDEVEPGRPHGNEGVLDARMVRQPVADRATEMAGEIVGDEIQVATRIGRSEGVQQREVPRSIARGRRLGQHLPVADTQRAVDPDLVESALVIQWHLDAVAVWRPARGWWEVARRYGAELVDTEDGRLRRWRRVERDDVGPFGTKSGSLLVAHSRVRRQRTPSRRKMRRTWLRAT